MPVFIAGSPRSGTTWIQELINYQHDHRVVFEPFWGKKVPVCACFRDWQYLRANTDDPTLLHVAESVISGDLRNEWVDQFNTDREYHKRLVKDVRANLMLAWLHANFPEMPIVLVLRHPFAVVSSQLRLGWRMKPTDLLAQEDLVSDHLASVRREIEDCTSDFDRNMLLWCIENSIPLRTLASGAITVVLYEKLLVDPETECRRLFDSIGYEYRDEVLQHFKRPSQLSVQDSAIKMGADPIASWQRDADELQILRMLELLRLFGLENVYGEAAMPLADDMDIVASG
jgi:hypothetical protein